MTGHLIVIPVHNEAETIQDVVARARLHGPVLVVDDGSTDASGAGAAAGGAEVLRLPRRSGKGRALRAGFAAALARGAAHVVTLDGDGQHDPAGIPRLLAVARAAPDALVIGGRLGAGDEPGVAAERVNAVRVAGFFLDWMTQTPLRDTQCGFRVYPASLLARGPGRRGGFVFESEVLLRAAATGHALLEVPVRARPLAGRPSRFRPWDGLAVAAFLTARAVAAWVAAVWMVACALLRPFTRERRRRRHRELFEVTGGLMAAGSPPAWAAAVGVFAAHRTAETWRRWWHDPRAERLRLVAVASALTPALLAATLAHPLLRRAGVDLVTPLVARAFSQERLARTFAAPAPVAAAPAA